MTTTTTTTTTDADLAILADLEAALAGLLPKVEAALQAVRRLGDYPGADFVGDMVRCGLDSGDQGSPASILGALRELREGCGDLGRYIWAVYEKANGWTPQQVVADLTTWDSDPTALQGRVDAYLDYRARLRARN